MTQAVTPTKLHPGGELMIEGSVPTVVSVLARDLQAACKGMDDVLEDYRAKTIRRLWATTQLADGEWLQ
jgi:hypothetical protein